LNKSINKVGAYALLALPILSSPLREEGGGRRECPAGYFSGLSVAKIEE